MDGRLVIPEVAYNYKYIIVAPEDDHYVFWGASNNENLASLAVLEVGGKLLIREDIK